MTDGQIFILVVIAVLVVSIYATILFMYVMHRLAEYEKHVHKKFVSLKRQNKPEPPTPSSVETPALTELKEIALELLEKYEVTEERLLTEIASGDWHTDLEVEVQGYKQLIEDTVRYGNRGGES